MNSSEHLKSTIVTHKMYVENKTYDSWSKLILKIHHRFFACNSVGKQNTIVPQKTQKSIKSIWKILLFFSKTPWKSTTVSQKCIFKNIVPQKYSNNTKIFEKYLFHKKNTEYHLQKFTADSQNIKKSTKKRLLKHIFKKLMRINQKYFKITKQELFFISFLK